MHAPAAAFEQALPLGLVSPPFCEPTWAVPSRRPSQDAAPQQVARRSTRRSTRQKQMQQQPAARHP
jgi:hypothetical protein